jgi:putative ABC transport system permease protein
VVADVKNDYLEEQADPIVYLPYAQNAGLNMNLVVRGSQDPAQLTSTLRAEVRALDPSLPVTNAATMQKMIYERASPKRLMTYILGTFGLLALVLSAVGIYGVMSYAVTQRTQEIGIRRALGAERRDVLKLIVGNGMKLTMLGIAIGLAGAFALTRLLANLLFHIAPTDVGTFGVVTFVLSVVALVACYMPARRAMEVDPLVALRYE